MNIKLVVLALCLLVGQGCGSNESSTTAGAPVESDAAGAAKADIGAQDAGPLCATATDCADGNECTVDLCDKVKGCSSVPKDCDDGDACNTDACDVVTGCKHKITSCDDDIECTTDKCDAATGCKHVADDGACDDSKVCTADKCDKAKGCLHPQVDCDDGNACTDDICDKVKECTSVPANCDDGDSCTTDSCDKSKGCVHALKPCDDNNECTSDTCDKVNGCKYKQLPCDDNIECTNDTCDPAQGCKSAADNSACDDGTVCTVDKCDKAKGCANVVQSCDDSDACTTESCDKVKGCVSSAKDCDDGTACTVDACDKAKGCINAPKVCDDGDSCTADLCDKFKGCVSSPKECSDNDACTEDSCSKTAGCKSTLKVCADTLECTTDSCDPKVGCKFEVKFGAPCGNGGFCDAAATCGKCVPKCDAGSCTDGCGGFCAGACNDKDACTENDACNSGKCQGTVKSCDDANSCTKDSCDSVTGCINGNVDSNVCGDGNACTDADKCTNGACSGTVKTCDDKNECTVDSCDPKDGCKNVAKTVASCSSGAGKCIDGGCCVPKCGTSQCGDDGCGGTCGACGATSACTAGKCVLVAMPKIEAVDAFTFPVSGEQVVPGYIAHLFGGKLLGEFALVQLKNPTTSPSAVVLTLELQGYSQPSETKVDLGPGESKTVKVNLTFNLPAIYALTTAVSANLKATLSMGGQTIDTYQQSAPLKITTKNTVFWNVAFSGSTYTPVHAFAATLVTPKNLEVQKLLSAAGKYSEFKAMGGYMELGSKKFEIISVSPSQGCTYRAAEYQAGQLATTSVMTQGAVGSNASYYLFDFANYSNFKSGKPAQYLIGSKALGSYTKALEISENGTYYHAFCTPSSNPTSVTFIADRTIGANDVVVDQLGAIHLALKAKGLIYTNVATDFFSGAQNVKTPGESLVTQSANCIDGSLVFASALEALGMEPLIIVVPGHAYVAVRDYPGAEIADDHWTAIETTMIGTATAYEAIQVGTKALFGDFANGKVVSVIDLGAARSAGIVPGGF